MDIGILVGNVNNLTDDLRYCNLKTNKTFAIYDIYQPVVYIAVPLPDTSRKPIEMRFTRRPDFKACLKITKAAAGMYHGLRQCAVLIALFIRALKAGRNIARDVLLAASLAFLFGWLNSGKGAVFKAAPWIDFQPGMVSPPTIFQPASPDSLSNTLASALSCAQKGMLKPGEPLQIELGNGFYPVSSPLTLDLGANGLRGHALEVFAAPGACPIVSGGVLIHGWQPTLYPCNLPSKSRGKVWAAALPFPPGEAPHFREIWVNGKKAVRARSPGPDTMNRLTGWNPKSQTAMIPASCLDGIRNPEGLEMVVDQVWEIAFLRIESIQYQGPQAILRFKDPESALEFGHRWPPITVNTRYQAPFFLANSIRFLDQPGEWFADFSENKLYYWPRKGEDLKSASVIVPQIETLLRIKGPSAAPASEVCFRGITFSHTAWLRPSLDGHVPLQAGMFLLKAGRLNPKGTPYHPHLDNVAWIGRPVAAICLDHACRVSFDDCRFEHLGSAGLDLDNGSSSDRVSGCRFEDIGGNGIQAGTFSETNVETHVPYFPGQAGEVCRDDVIEDTLFDNCGTEDWGCVGVAAGYVHGMRIVHNELVNLPYTGISLGWGWTPRTNASGDNLVFANRIHSVAQKLGDTGGIYTLSAQPGTLIESNEIENIQPSPYVPDPQHWFYIYLDEGSSHIRVQDNACPSPKFLKNANGPGNLWINNGPQNTPLVSETAGIRPAGLRSIATSCPQ